MQADSWDSLGFQMQEIPALKSLIVVEGKINAFINCYVGVQRITSLFDLEVAICKNEGIEKFEELELGPFLKHPLVMHYFSIGSDVTSVYEITSQEVVSHLSELIDLYKGKSFVAEDLLKFIAKKCQVDSWEKLGVRIHSLEMYIAFVRQARSSEDSLLQKFRKTVATNSMRKRKKRPLLSLEKQHLDERFSAITQRIASFSSMNKDYCGKYTRFLSSSSDDDEDDGNDDDDRLSPCLLSSFKTNSCDRVSNCPHPSVYEERMRYSLKSEVGSASSPISRANDSQVKHGKRKKRRYDDPNDTTPSLHKSHSRKKSEQKYISKTIDDTERDQSNFDESSLLLGDDSLRMFITTWKEACREHNAAKVLEKMLDFYDASSQQKNKMKSVFSTYPFLGLLNVALTSIKNGIWDSMYDAFQSIADLGETDRPSSIDPGFESIDVEESAPSILNMQLREHKLRLTVDDIMKKVKEFFAMGIRIPSGVKTPVEKILLFVRKLSECEDWLCRHFSVKEFRILGYGEYLMFLEKHSSILPTELREFLESRVLTHCPLEVMMLQKLLVSLLSQATGSLWVDESVTKQKILDLVIRQYPTVSFTFSENGSLEDLLNCLKQEGSDILCSSVLFSAALSGTYKYNDSMHYEGKDFDNIGTIGQIEGRTESITSKKALEVLLKAPMLCDLSTWSHWDLLYAPSLGPLLGWLLNEVNCRDLICLVTKDGKIVRIDPLASVKSFFESLLQGSSFQVAVNILSLFAISGGRTQVPLSLLKRQSCQAFEALLSSSNGYTGTKVLTQERTLGKSMTGTDARVGLKCETEPISHLCKLALNCFSYLPSEFRCFAAEILLCGLQSIAKDAASAVLSECGKAEERLMLHELGFCLGIMEWIDDHVALCPLTNGDSLYSLENGSVVTGKFSQDRLVESSCYKTKLPSSAKVDQQCENSTDMKSLIEGSDTCQREEKIGQAEVGLEKNAELLIESIRREEFGLDPNLTKGESSILKKQHARLGRALHCLSQELYSQDSHFLLELVQNADDNLYPLEVEPTLMFILQDTSIVILNNERGFTAKNIRALCDVGSSTKKGSAGYIGQKGIGFKSVFKVTDAPEIHSNGFHVKFDISEGQIGFVLPTIVPPCDKNLIEQLASAGADKMTDYSWNTCIVLPFRSKLSDGAATNSIFSMFSDLRPSLLLFLHRLRCIKFKNVIDDSLIVMRKEIVGNGIVNVTQGEENTTWFLASQRLQHEVLRDKVEETEISIAFSLEESAYGYESCLKPQPVFAFLPLRTYGLKFILQGDFVLPSSREEIDGDSPWNQWLLSEFPDLFVSAQKPFCALHCYEENLGKAVSVYLSFVPLVGEVHGFFSCLPRMIISKLRLSNCLLLEGSKDEWVPPCKVIRGWNESARLLLPDTLLVKHLGLGFLDKDIILSDSLANSLGIVQYGPKILVKLLISLSLAENGLISMGLSWLLSLLNEIHYMLAFSYGQQAFKNSEEADLINTLKGVPFIPLSDGSYSSLNEGTIWLSTQSLGSGFDGEHGYNDFPHLFATLRIVSPALFSPSDKSVIDATLINNVSQMLHKIGVQRLSTHDIIKVHVLPSICDEKIAKSSKDLMIDYFAFLMLHFQSICVECYLEREILISELCNKAFVCTNDGYKKPNESSIHFSTGYGNSFDVNKLLNSLDYHWLEVDLAYLKHPVTGPLPGGMMKWREFFQHLGVTDFVKVVRVQKSIAELSHSLLQRVITEGCIISPGLIATDWESEELTCMLSMISNNGNRDRSKHLLEILDALWDVHFHDKAVGHLSGESGRTDFAFKSSFMNEICGVQWVASTMDNRLHCANELFHDCEAVRSVIGASAPYTILKIRSEKLLIDLGLKTQVTVDDILALLQLWRGSKSPFRTSISQMSKFYAFIWSALSTSRQIVMEALNSGAFVFVPSGLWNSCEDDVAGVFLSPGKVHWHDSTGAMDYIKQQNHSTEGPDWAVRQTLSNIYPGLFGFFVNECGVNESPPLQKYIPILRHLSNNSLPLQAAKIVFRVLVRWFDGFSCSTVSSDDIAYFKELLSQPDFTVLPTTLDQWVSLHPSFGLLCWCDNDMLRQEFCHSENINFLHFGELCAKEKEIVRTKVLLLLQKLGIPSLSEIVTREAVYHGPANRYLLASVVNWVLPFAQRYIYNFHSDQYQQLKLSRGGFKLTVVVVEQLFYRNVIKRAGTFSKIRHDCSCLLQDYTLYATQGSDPHSIFIELSCLFFGGVPQLSLANFLLMIKSMAESGCTGEYLESFIVNGQKMVKLPDEEPVWTLVSTSTENMEAYSLSAPVELSTSEQHLPSSNYKKNMANSSWPPVDWKTAPDFRHAHANGSRVNMTGNMGYNLVHSSASSSDNVALGESIDPRLTRIEDNMIIEVEDIDAVALAPPAAGLDEIISISASSAALINPVNIDVVECQFPEAGPSKPCETAQSVGAQQAILVGKLGESVASRYLSEKYGDKAGVRWMNKDDETGLPYDIVIKEEGKSEEYIEVKATRYESKAWFIVSTREWKFAQDKGDAYTIAHVTLSSGKAAKITLYKNPVKLCQSGKLRLAMMIPKPYV